MSPASKAVVFIAACFCVPAFTGCTREEEESAVSYTRIEVPPHFPSPVYAPVSFAGSKDVFTLGKQLFYDPILSSDSSISCASCHRQSHAFSDPGNAVSEGVGGRTGKRNSPGLFNIAWMPAFMWDGGINHLEVMPVAPITDTSEMRESMLNVVNKLNRNANYRQQFQKAFGSAEVNDQRLLQALSWFMAQLISAESDYDQYALGKSRLSDEAMNGLSLFRTHCATCHPEPLFTDFSYRNNGRATAADPGRGRITQQAEDNGKFKVPSLRNVELTAPYFHNGSAATLEEVLEHYSSGLGGHAGIDSSLAIHGSGFGFSDAEKSALIAFLKSLTDVKFTENEELGE